MGQLVLLLIWNQNNSNATLISLQIKTME